MKMKVNAVSKADVRSQNPSCDEVSVSLKGAADMIRTVNHSYTFDPNLKNNKNIHFCSFCSKRNE